MKTESINNSSIKRCHGVTVDSGEASGVRKHRHGLTLGPHVWTRQNRLYQMKLTEPVHRRVALGGRERERERVRWALSATTPSLWGHNDL